MKRAIIVRQETGDDGTFGKLFGPGGFECYTAELPWRDLDGDRMRDRGASCVRAGDYQATWSESPTRKNPDGTPEWSYRLSGVPDADGILIHSGNFAGDGSMGYVSDARGCILLGRAIIDDMEVPERRRAAAPEKRARQKGVSSSRDTVAAFAELMARKPFLLSVRWAPGVCPDPAADVEPDDEVSA